MGRVDFVVARSVAEKLRDREWVDKQLELGRKGRELFAWGEESVVVGRQIAHSLMEQGKYVEAEDALLFLVTIDPDNQELWLAMGIAAQYQGTFERAIDAYEVAAMCGLENPMPYWYLAKCFFALHERDHALQAVELALEVAAGREEYRSLIEEAEEAKKWLEHL